MRLRPNTSQSRTCRNADRHRQCDKGILPFRAKSRHHSIIATLIV
jgi:hypothetical protein